MKRDARARLTAPLLTALALTAPGFASAQESDGVYGRLSGDTRFVGGVGLAAERGGPAFETHVGLSYLSTAGAYARYTEAFGREEMTTARSISFGAELRPLFLGRYALNLAQGPAHADLFLDSFNIACGVVFSQAPESESGRPGAESGRPGAEFGRPGFEFGLGIGVPILPQASGPWFEISGVLRWRASDFDDGRADLLERGSLLIMSLAWHQVFDAGLVDARDSRDPARHRD